MSPTAGRSEYAPAAVRHVYDELVRLAPELGVQLGGIVGDSSHTYGYHRARAVLRDDDYSVLLWRDRRGDQWAASALDLSPASAEDVKTLTSRLAAAAAAGDRRLTRVVREFYGTLDGENVYGWDVRYRTPRTSDRSHLWHVHLSFYRMHTNERALLAPVAAVLAGR